MNAVIALVGRPNVGKSTLFNRLTRSREALVADQPGLTRDRHYGLAQFGERSFWVVDTGGFEPEQKEGIVAEMARQTRQAIGEADAVFFVVDAAGGLTVQDEEIGAYLRRTGKPVWLLVNKVDAKGARAQVLDFHVLGLGHPWAVAAAHGTGVAEVLGDVVTRLPRGPEGEAVPVAGEAAGPRIAVLGRPNVGKSTLVNAMLGEERVIVFDQPGTTRDSIRIPYERFGKPYVMIDTAGVRRRGRVGEGVEKLSVIKTLQAVDEADIVLLVLDARQEVADQDAHLAGLAVERGRPLVIVVNKWDHLDPHQKDRIREQLDRRLVFVSHAPRHFISALHGTGVGELYRSIDRLWTVSRQHLSTNRLNQILADAVAAHHPPMVGGRRIKIRYCHQGGEKPLTLVFHGNQLSRLPGAYRRYLEGRFRAALDLDGVPLMLVFRKGENPFVKREG